MHYNKGNSELISQGINVQDILKLKAAGIVTVLGVSQTTRKNLLKIKVSYWSRSIDAVRLDSS